MKTKTIGVFLIAVGMLMIAYTGYKYVTNSKSVEIGAYEITKDENHIIKWPLIAGATLLIGGVVVLVLDKKFATKS